jgi:hypothetical protein
LIVFYCVPSFLIYFLQEQGYSERWTTHFWEYFHKYPLKVGPLKAKLLDIILFADETVTSLWNGTDCHPIVMTLGNLPIWKQATHDAKLVIGYVPKLTGMNTPLHLLSSYFTRKYVGTSL